MKRNFYSITIGIAFVCFLHSPLFLYGSREQEEQELQRAIEESNQTQHTDAQRRALRRTIRPSLGLFGGSMMRMHQLAQKSKAIEESAREARQRQEQAAQEAHDLQEALALSHQEEAHRQQIQALQEKRAAVPVLTRLRQTHERRTPVWRGTLSGYEDLRAKARDVALKKIEDAMRTYEPKIFTIEWQGYQNQIRDAQNTSRTNARELASESSRSIALPTSLRDVPIVHLRSIRQVNNWPCGLHALYNAWYINQLIQRAQERGITHPNELALLDPLKTTGYSYEDFQKFAHWAMLVALPASLSASNLPSFDPITGVWCKNLMPEGAQENYLSNAQIKNVINKMPLGTKPHVLSVGTKIYSPDFENIPELIQTYKQQCASVTRSWPTLPFIALIESNHWVMASVCTLNGTDFFVVYMDSQNNALPNNETKHASILMRNLCELVQQ